MLAFCKENSRDFLPIFDVLVDDMPNQASLALKADIRLALPLGDPFDLSDIPDTSPTGSRPHSRSNAGTNGSARLS